MSLVPGTIVAADAGDAEVVAQPRLLIIEDDVDTRLGLQVLLEAHQFDVVATDSGEHGIELVEAHEPEVILLDLGLPGIDGFQVLERLRSNAVFSSDPRIIVLSAWSPAGSEVRAIEAGASMYVQKPFSGTQLIDAIHFVLSLDETADLG